MTNQFEADYKSLHAAAVTLAAKMMATLTDPQLIQMEAMTKQGAKLILEIELPNCKEVALFLREIEGGRHAVCKLGATQ